MVLHNVANDAKFVKVASAALGAKRFFKGDDNAGDVVTVPGRAKNPVAEPNELVREEPISPPPPPPPTSSTTFLANDACLERTVAAVACECSLR